MQKRRKIAEVYEEYKKRSDITIVIDGEEYFRVIDRFRMAGFGTLILPNEVFKLKGTKLCDELGNTFDIGSPMHYSFRGEIPEWYKNTISLTIKGIEIDKVGEYVCLVKE